MMLRKYLPLVLILLLPVAAVTAQNLTDVDSIRWTGVGKTLRADGSEGQLPVSNRTYALPGQQSLPYLNVQLTGKAVGKASLSKAQYAPMTADESQDITAQMLAAAEPIIVQNGWYRGIPAATVEVLAIRQSGMGSFEKLISYQLSYTTVQPDYQPEISKISPVSGALNKVSVNSSALSSGTIYKVAVSESGMYSIGRDFFTANNIDPSGLNPRQFQIFGNGGNMLPQPNATPRVDDLAENPILVTGEADGSFDAGDRIVFYAKGPTGWEKENGKDRFRHQKNLYSDKAYYFLKVGEANGKRITSAAPATGATIETVNYYNDRHAHESDTYNLLNSGKEWYGEEFQFQPNRTFSVDMPGLRAGSPVNIVSSVMSVANTGNSFSVNINGQPALAQNLGAIPAIKYAHKGVAAVNEANVNTTASPLQVSYTFNGGGPSTSRGYLNYFTINAVRDLALYGGQTSFRVFSASDAVRYQVSGTDPDVRIWDVTVPYDAREQGLVLNNGTAEFLADNDILREFVTFKPNALPSPEFVGGVTNQNLHGLAGAKAIIVAPAQLLPAAEQLAAHRRSHSNMSVHVVSTSQIYNEFSSGAQDITAIRDFARMVYLRSQGADSLNYLVLFGDGSFDYKDRVPNNTNLVPIYETDESLHNIFSQSTDDFFGFMDVSEGRFAPNDVQRLDLGIGRLPVKNLSEAYAVVQKIIGYDEMQPALAKWRNTVTLAADDGDGNLHLRDSEGHAANIQAKAPVYNLNKIYLDATTLTSTANGITAAQAREMITERIEKGTLIFNYVGHGGTGALADERMINLDMLNSFENLENLSFWVTATCDFGKYDDPSIVSGGELVVLQPNGGGIGTLTTTRPVYASSNQLINEDFFNNVFKLLPDGSYPKLGDVNRATKNGHYIFSNWNFALLGDPTMALAYAEQEMVITNFNGHPMTANDSLSALSIVELEGEVRDRFSGSVLTGYNGQADITIFDRPSKIETFGRPGNSVLTFDLRKDLIFQGKASITGGAFKVKFVVPKSISYNGIGKISLYGKPGSGLMDAHGFRLVPIGGTNPNAVADDEPPLIQLFMDDETFVNGGVTGSNPTLLAKLSDDHGININSSIGKGIEGVVSNKPTDVISLNDNYEAAANDYTSGKVLYDLKDLAPGDYSIKVSASDTYNNTSDETVDFTVLSSEDLEVRYVLNYPNPFFNSTAFQFDHNRAGSDLDVKVEVYTVSGKLIKTMLAFVPGSSSLVSGQNTGELVWDGRDDFGDRIGKGVYIYKLSVNALGANSSKTHEFQKLVILN